MSITAVNYVTRTYIMVVVVSYLLESAIMVVRCLLVRRVLNTGRTNRGWYRL